jgi:hypothetical protein
MPPTFILPEEGHGRDDSMNSSIACRQSGARPGYQLPAKSARLTVMKDYLLAFCNGLIFYRRPGLLLMQNFLQKAPFVDAKFLTKGPLL